MLRIRAPERAMKTLGDARSASSWIHMSIDIFRFCSCPSRLCVNLSRTSAQLYASASMARLPGNFPFIIQPLKLFQFSLLYILHV